MIFRNRIEAGERLAKKLKKEFLQDPVVIALPRGGVPIGFEIAQALQVPLDVLVIRKVGAPMNPEYGIGAIGEGGLYWIDPDAVQSLSISDFELKKAIQSEFIEMERRVHRFRDERPLVDVKGKTTLLIDDGLATGVTARVASQILKDQGAKRIILAVPVCARSSAKMLSRFVDQVICLESPEPFSAVGNWYEDFTQTTDEEVEEFLKRARHFGKVQEVEITEGKVKLTGNLVIPDEADGIVIFAHGSGSSRHSPRNIQVAQTLNEAGLGTLLFDLLTPHEAGDRGNVFNIPLLAKRLVLATKFLQTRTRTADYRIGYFGASTGAGAALWAAAELGSDIKAVVSRGGRPDLAIPKIKEVSAPTLLLVGGHDKPVIEMNEEALKYLMTGNLIVIPGATHLFEESGALEQVAEEAVTWFLKYLKRSARREAA